MSNTLNKTCPKNGNHFTISGTSARNSTAISADTVTVHSSVDCYFKIGGSDVVASSTDYDMHLVAGAYIEVRMNGQSYIAAIQASSGGTFYYNEEK